MATKKINKIQLSTKNRVQRRFGPIVSEDIYNTIYEIINDIQSFRIQWNNVIYPLISSLPNQLNQYSPRLNESIIDPVLNGFDGTQVFVDRLTNLNKDNGKYYNTSVTPNRPNTIKEQFDWTYKYVDTKIEEITKLFGDSGIPDEVKERIGINAWEPTTASRGTNYFGPNDESIDARSLNNKADIYQILSDVFGVDPNTKIGDVISSTDYTIDDSHPGVRTLKKTIRERLIGLEKIHSITNEQENKEPNHCHLILFDDESYTASSATNKLTIDAKTESGTFKTIFNIQGDQYESELVIKHSGGDNVSYDVLRIKKDTTNYKPLFLVDGYIKTTNEYILLNNKELDPPLAGIKIYRGASKHPAELLYDGTIGRWKVWDNASLSYKRICIEGECGGGSGGSVNIPELFRYSRTLFGVAGDTTVEINSSGEQHIMTGTLQDGAYDNILPDIGWERKYRLQIQYSDNFETIDSSINTTLKITLLDTLDVYTITLPQCQNLDSLDSHILHITNLLDIDFANHDFEITLEINNFQSGAIFNLYKIELVAFDVPTSTPSTTWNTSSVTTTSWNTTRQTTASGSAQTQTSSITQTTWNTTSNFATVWATSWNTSQNTTTTWQTAAGSSWTTTWATSSQTSQLTETSVNTTTTWNTLRSTSRTTSSSRATSQQTNTSWTTTWATSSGASTSWNTTTTWNTTYQTSSNTLISTTTNTSLNTSRTTDTTWLTTWDTITTWVTTWNTSSHTLTEVGQTVHYNSELHTLITDTLYTLTQTTWATSSTTSSTTQTSSNTSSQTTTSWNTTWATTTSWNALTSWNTTKTTSSNTLTSSITGSTWSTSASTSRTTTTTWNTTAVWNTTYNTTVATSSSTVSVWNTNTQYLTTWNTSRTTSDSSLINTSQTTETTWATSSITSSNTSTTKQTSSNTVTSWNTSTGSGSTWNTTVVTSSNTTTTWATSS